jgi:Zn-dependent protease
MRGWTRLGRINAFGAPIYLHWSIFVVVGILAIFALRNPIYAILFIASYFAIIFVHEFGHAFVAHRLGYCVDSIWVTCWHGWCRCEAPDNEWNAVLIAWGGVGAQLIIALPALGILAILGDRDWSYFTPIIVFLGYLNIVIAVTNMLPGEDTDGKVAWRLVPLLLEERREKKRSRIQRGRR